MGYVDLHCHFVPAIDDGVRTLADGLRLCQEMAKIGYDHMVATPHIRTGMFDNQKQGIEAAFAAVQHAATATPNMPTLGLAAEHFCDDVFFGLLAAGKALPYPGDHAALVEMPPDHLPLNIEAKLFQMNVRGIRPVIAHPERYTPLFASTRPLERMLDMGVLLQLDVMSLTGRYGRAPKKAAERMLKEDVYFLACSDSHRWTDAETVADGIRTLRKVVGVERADTLLGENPRRILSGALE